MLLSGSFVGRAVILFVLVSFGTEGCMGTETSVQNGHARIKTHAR